MPKRSDAVLPLSVFATNLVAAITHEAKERDEKFSVNAWAVRHTFTQTTINRIVTGKLDPTTEMIERIAGAVGLAPWQMFVPGLDIDHPPVMQDSNQRELIDRLKKVLVPSDAMQLVSTDGKKLATAKRDKVERRGTYGVGLRGKPATKAKGAKK